MRRRGNVIAPIDSISTLVEQLQQTDSSVEDGETAWVRSTQELYVYRVNSGLIPDGINVIASLYGNGVWQKLNLAPVSSETLNIPTVVGVSASLKGTIPTSSIAAVVDGYTAAGDGGGGVFYWDLTSTTPDNGGTVINPTGHVTPGRWLRVYAGALELKWFGAFCDNGTDDTASIQACIDALGDTTHLRTGTINLPNGGTSVISATLVFDRKSCVFQGPGAGSSTGIGFAFRWNGATGIPMVQIKRCESLKLSGIRFIGKTANPPSEAINFLMTAGDAPPNTDNVLERIWIGGVSGLDTAVPNGFTKGITTTGQNAQNDQSAMRDITITDFIDAGIDFTQTQNVVWRIDHVVINAGAVGIRSGTRFVEIDNATFSSLTNVIELTGDGSAVISNFGCEGNSRFLSATSAAQYFMAVSGYYQSDAALMPGDNAIINVSTGAFQLTLNQVAFTRSGVFAPGQEQIKVRGTKCVIQVMPSVTWVDALESAHFDFATAIAGDVRQVWWGIENYYNNWTHGDNLALGARWDVVTSLRLKAGATMVAETADTAAPRSLISVSGAGVVTWGASTLTNQFVSDLVGNAGLDINGFRILSLNQAISRINFAEAAHQTHQIQANSVDVITMNDNAGATGGLGFFTHAPAAKPTVAGAKVDPVAASILAALVAVGLVIDTTT